MSPTALLALLLGPLLGLALYRRFTKSLGRQLLARRRMIARCVLLSVIGVAFLASLPTVAGFAAAFAGAVLGSALAVVGLAHTQWDVTPEGTFYTPNKWIGLGVLSLFLGRLGVRLLAVYRLTEQALLDGTSPEIDRSPVTLGFFFLFAAYYVAYYLGVLRKGSALPGT